MARLRYFIVKHQGEWKIKYDGEHYGPYKTQRDAMQAAINAAHKLGSQGHDSQVLVQNANNEFRAEWTYGHDPYPPRG